MIRFSLNGTDIAVDAPAERSLLEILREDLNHTVPKPGCAIGRCGACMVLVDGAAMNACLIMGGRVTGHAVTTLPGLADHPVGQALREGLTEQNAFQCGYCAPGVSMSLAGLLLRNPEPDDEEIAEALEGNICRCTGYHSILRGVRAAIRILKETT